VASKIRFDAAEQRIRALAYAGLGSVELRVSVLAELARVCPAEGAFFPTADPATLLYTSAVRTGMPGGLTGRFLHNEFSTPDVNKFRWVRLFQGDAVLSVLMRLPPGCLV
jgi:hypothetical protein